MASLDSSRRPLIGPLARAFTRAFTRVFTRVVMHPLPSTFTRVLCSPARDIYPGVFPGATVSATGSVLIRYESPLSRFNLSRHAGGANIL